MNDMSSIIVPRSDQINSDELQNGQTITVTITDVKISGGQEQPVTMRLAETDKFYRPCKSMCRVLVAAWGLDAKQYVGKSLTLYCDPTVKFGPLAVGGLRISHMSHIDGPLVMALTATKGVKKAYKVQPLVGPTAPSEPATKARQTPEEWAEAHIASLTGAASSEEAAAIRQKGAKAVERLQRDHPLLYRAILAADPSSGPTTDDDPFGLPPLDDPSDTDRGESHTADDLIAQIERIEGDADLVDSFLALHADTIDAYEPEVQRKIRGAANARRIELREVA